MDCSRDRALNEPDNPGEIIGGTVFSEIMHARSFHTCVLFFHVSCGKRDLKESMVAHIYIRAPGSEFSPSHT